MERLAQEAIARFGRIDVLVNRAGFSVTGGFLDHGPGDGRKVTWREGTKGAMVGRFAWMRV